MNAKLVKESLNDIFKPKTEEELGDTYRLLKQKTDETMTKIFKDLHRDPKHRNIYINNEGEWVFKYNSKTDCIFIRFTRLWPIFNKELNINFNIADTLIQCLVKENAEIIFNKINYI